MMNTIFFPGWAIPPHFYGEKIIDYHFFDDSPACDMQDFIPKKLPPNTHVIGHSMGTLLAVLTALKFPNEVTKLTLYAPFVQFASTPSHHECWENGAVEHLINQVAQAPQVALKRFYRNVFHPAPPTLRAPNFVNIAQLQSGLFFLINTNLESKLSLLQYPTLTIVYGTEDKVVPPPMTQAFIDSLTLTPEIVCKTGASHGEILF